MESHIQGHPDELILLPFLAQPARTSDLSLNPSLEDRSLVQADKENFSFINCVDGSATFQPILRKFSKDIRRVHKSSILWPVDNLQRDTEMFFSNSMFYKDLLLLPIADLFNQLRFKFILNALEVRMHSSECNHVHIYEFFSVDFEVLQNHTPLNPPTVIILDEYCSFDDGRAVPGHISGILEEGWRINPMAKILMTDLRSLFIIHPLDKTHGVVQYESKKIDHRLEILRVCVAAYLYDSFPEDSYLLVPFEPNYMDDIKPSGAPIDPETPLVEDEIVFRTSHRNSDFDYYTLTRDRDRALQFFRWRSHVKDAVKLKHVSTGTSLLCETNGFRKMHCTYKPVYDVEDLPQETKDHIEMTKRSNFDSDVLSSFRASESFGVEVLEDFTFTSPDAAPELNICRTYKCRITEINGQPVNLTRPVFVKLFDDRFYQMDEPFNSPPNVSWWFFSYVTAEDKIRREIAVYEKMEFAQGSLIPYFFGAHKFVLSDGHKLFGIIMEYVPGRSLSGGGAAGLSNDMQIQFIQSTRHALRALQFSDVSQLEWSGGQILCVTDSTSANCVLVDFATAFQTLNSNFDPGKDDFASCLNVLLETKHGLNRELVWSNFAERETWDVKRYGVEDNGKDVVIGGPDPFAFIYDLPE